MLSVFTDEEAPEEGSHEFVDVETDTVSAEEEFDYCDLETITDDEGSMPTTAIATSPVNASKFEELVDMVPRKADGSKNVESTAIPEGVAVAKAESPRLVGTASADSHGVVEAVLETLVDAVVKHSSIDEAACVGPDAGVEPPEGEEAAKALVPAVSRPRIDGVEAFDELTANEGEVNDAEASERTAPESLVAEVSSPENSKEGIFAVEGVVSPATPRSSKKRSVVKSSKRSASIASKFKWVPLDPTNSSLIWVQGSADADTKSALEAIHDVKRLGSGVLLIQATPGSFGSNASRQRLEWSRDTRRRRALESGSLLSRTTQVHLDPAAAVLRCFKRGSSREAAAAPELMCDVQCRQVNSVTLSGNANQVYPFSISQYFSAATLIVYTAQLKLFSAGWFAICWARTPAHRPSAAPACSESYPPPSRPS